MTLILILILPMQTGKKSFHPDASWPSWNNITMLVSHFSFQPFKDMFVLEDDRKELKNEIDPKQHLLPTSLVFAIEEGDMGSSEKKSGQDEKVTELLQP
jgi:hypothetical protein